MHFISGDINSTIACVKPKFTIFNDDVPDDHDTKVSNAEYDSDQENRYTI